MNKYIVNSRHSLWNYFHNLTVLHTDDIKLCVMFLCCRGDYEIAETLQAAGVQEKSLKLIQICRVCRDWPWVHKSQLSNFNSKKPILCKEIYIKQKLLFTHVLFTTHYPSCSCAQHLLFFTHQQTYSILQISATRLNSTWESLFNCDRL